MKSLSSLLTVGAISLLGLMPAAAQAETLLANFDIPAAGVAVSWEQDSNPTPITYSVTDGFTLVPIFDFQSTGATAITGWMDMTYYLASEEGGIVTPTPAFSFLPSPVSQQFTGSLSAPVFSTGSYSGIEFNTQDHATLTFAVVPPVGAPGPVPGAGLAGLAALALAGLYARTRRA
ncbi:MAG: hypothetical protein WBS22_11875 [Methylocystis sp.]